MLGGFEDLTVVLAASDAVVGEVEYRREGEGKR